MAREEEKYLKQMGTQIRTARLRRNLTVEQVAEKAGMSAATAMKIEQGSPSVTLGKLAAVLTVLGLEESLVLVAAKDEKGEKLQLGELRQRARPKKRAAKRTKLKVKAVKK